jgi:Zn-dependent peptidase ImmA (M78 family)
MTRSQLSDRLGIEREQLDEELKRKPEPRQGFLNAVARELALPPFLFFMQTAPPLHDILPDFRSEASATSAKSRETIEAIQVAEGLQRAAVTLGAPKAGPLPQLSATSVEEAALAAREFFGINLEDQREAKDARAFYTLCRKKIEDKGVFVLHATFPPEDGSGFCLSHATHPVIVVNTKRQSRGRRLFTLIHELAHILLGKSGISDPFINRNSTERLCNRFAGSFLVPSKYVTSLLGKLPPTEPSREDVAWASRRLKISQEASVLRLEQLGIFKAGSHDNWKKSFIGSTVDNPDFADKGGGRGGAPAQEKVKLARYGFRVANVFGRLASQGRVDEIGIYRLLGLKPKYQRPYFDYANSLNAGSLLSLDLDDE